MPLPSVTTTGVEGSARDANREAAEAQSLLRRALEDLKLTSTYTQVGWGAANGWLASYLGVKVGRLAALTLGGSLLALQVARHKGYITGTGEKLDADVSEVRDSLQDDVTSAAPAVAGEAKKFAGDNKYVAAGFVGGLLIGVAYS